MINAREQSILIAHQNPSSLAQSEDTLLRKLNHFSGIGAAINDGGGAASPRDSYACDPKPFEGDFNKCRGFIMQCRLIFVQRAHLFPSDQTKINFIIGLLRGRALAQASASTLPEPLLLD